MTLPIPSFLHLLNLDTVGGVEELFVAFLENVQRAFPHHVLVTGKSPHDFFKERLTQAADSLTLEKYLFGVKVPSLFRKARREYVLKKTKANTLVLWNRIEPLKLLPQGISRIYYEHGASWMLPADSASKSFFSQMDRLLANSFAARRLMQLKWDIKKPIQVIENPLKPTILARKEPKTLNSERPLCLGYIGRLIPLKGVALIPHVVKGLINNHVPVECLIAGEGSERASIEKIASSLGVLHAIKFLGCIQNVSSFYETIDILLVPSIREPLGLVAQEAALAGCPVVASCVDGLPEVVIDKKTGFCPPPTLPLKSLASFGGTHAQLPDLVFDPINDCLMEPKIVDPNALVSSLLEIISSNERFYVMSKQAILQAKKRPTISHYAQALLDALVKL